MTIRHATIADAVAAAREEFASDGGDGSWWYDSILEKHLKLVVPPAQAAEAGLLPCPFCGGGAMLDPTDPQNGAVFFSAICNARGGGRGCGASRSLYSTAAEAAEAWNARAPRPSLASDPAAVERAAKAAALYCELPITADLYNDFAQTILRAAEDTTTSPPPPGSPQCRA